MAVLTDAEARRMLELLKEALSPKSITLNKGEKQPLKNTAFLNCTVTSWTSRRT